MRKPYTIVLLMFFALLARPSLAQECKTSRLSGKLLTDQRCLLASPNKWAWNENRLAINLEKKIANSSNFYSEVWLRNMGLPRVESSENLYNKGIIDPYNFEIREAYVQLLGVLSKKLDVKIGRQRIAWGTADKISPTDNLNPYDMEDVLDFGRHRGTDAINLQYYFGMGFSLQAVLVPFFRPANMPIGIFAHALAPKVQVQGKFVPRETTGKIGMPGHSWGQNVSAGARLKGFLLGMDVSLSYVWGRDGIPIKKQAHILPLDTLGSVAINTKLSFSRTHIFGADMAANLNGVGVWAELAAFLPHQEVVATTDLSAFFPQAPVPVIKVETILERRPYLKFVVGADYNFPNAAYINAQYLHGFVTERGKGSLKDYFFLRVNKKFFDEKLKLTPIGGSFIVSNWKDIKNNHTFVYLPEISYMATDNAEIIFSAAIIGGKGGSVLSSLGGCDMLVFKLKYSF